MRVGRLSRVTGCEKAEMASPPRRVSADLGRPGRPETGHKEIKCLQLSSVPGEKSGFKPGQGVLPGHLSLVHVEILATTGWRQLFRSCFN